MTHRLQVGVLVFEGFEELDAVGPFDVLGTATSFGADWTVDLLATEETDVITAAGGLRVEPDGVLPAATTGDGSPSAPSVLVVPGGGWNDRAATGAWAQAQDEALLERLRAVHDAGTTIAAVCTGGMVLATAGLLDDRPAVTHHGAMGELRETDATVVDARVVDDGDLLTAGGVTAGIDLALRLVEREWGGDVAAAVASELEYERRGDVYRSGSA